MQLLEQRPRRPALSRQQRLALASLLVLLVLAAAAAVLQALAAGGCSGARPQRRRLTSAAAGAESSPLALLRPDNSSYIALCSVVKGKQRIAAQSCSRLYMPRPGPPDLSLADEHAHIREWVLYHHMLGVNRFYLFDDNSRPPLAGVLADLVAAGLVHYNFWLSRDHIPNSTIPQDFANNECLHKHGKAHRWIGGWLRAGSSASSWRLGGWLGALPATATCQNTRLHMPSPTPLHDRPPEV